MAKKDEAPATGALVTRKDDVALTADLLKTLGMDEAPDQLERTTSGGVTKWIDLVSFQADPAAPQNKPVLGNGQGFAGILMGISEMEVDDGEGGEMNDEGKKVRYFYTLRLASPCPVTFKDDNGNDVKEIAQPGEVVSIGERHQFQTAGWRDMVSDGGIYLVVVKPHSRRKIKGGRTMWTFDTWKKTIKPAVKIVAAPAKTPF